MRRHLLALLAILLIGFVQPAEALTKIVCFSTPGDNAWTVPSDWTGTNSEDLVSGGAGAASAVTSGNWGLAGGGGLTLVSFNITLTPGAVINVHVATGGAGQPPGTSAAGGNGDGSYICNAVGANCSYVFSTSTWGSAVVDGAPGAQGGPASSGTSNGGTGASCGSIKVPASHLTSCEDGGGGATRAGGVSNAKGNGGGGGAGGLVSPGGDGGYGPATFQTGSCTGGGGGAGDNDNPVGTPPVGVGGVGSPTANSCGTVQGPGGIGANGGGNGGLGGNGASNGSNGANGTEFAAESCYGAGGGGGAASPGFVGGNGGIAGGGGGSGSTGGNGGSGAQGIVLITYTSSGIGIPFTQGYIAMNKIAPNLATMDGS